MFASEGGRKVYHSKTYLTSIPPARKNPEMFSPDSKDSQGLDAGSGFRPKPRPDAVRRQAAPCIAEWLGDSYLLH